MSAAVQRVFEIPELLELVLLQLSLRSLLSVQLVSKCFHNTIRSSPALQHALYFRSIPSLALSVWTPNRLLIEVFPPWFIYPDEQYCVPDKFSFDAMPWVASIPRRDAILRKEASWRDMLPVQPPPKKLTILRSLYSYNGIRSQAYTELQREGGITMGLLYDSVERFFAALQPSGFEPTFLVRWLLDEAPGKERMINLELCCQNHGPALADCLQRGTLRSRASETRHQDFKWEDSYQKALLNPGWEEIIDGPWEMWSDLTPEKGAILAAVPVCTMFD